MKFLIKGFLRFLKRFVFFAYLVVFRRVHKFFLRKYTQSCEIERMILTRNYQGLVFSVEHSKQLPILSNYIRHRMNYAYIDLTKLEELYFVKRIPNISSRRKVIEDAFGRINCVFLSLHHVENVRKTQYDAKNPDHEEKLLKIWKLLRNDKVLSGRYSKDWIEIGFQGSDPATDFRGAGRLGLENLLHFLTKYNKEAKHIWQTSQNISTQYFMCSAGLFITLFTWEVMNERKLDEYFMKCRTEEEALEAFGQIYSRFFIEFNNFYEKEPRNMMNFNTIIEAYFKDLKRSVINMKFH